MCLYGVRALKLTVIRDEVAVSFSFSLSESLGWFSSRLDRTIRLLALVFVVGMFRWVGWGSDRWLPPPASPGCPCAPCSLACRVSYVCWTCLISKQILWKC